MTIATTIKKKYLNEKYEMQRLTGVFIEHKPFNEFWRKRLDSLAETPDDMINTEIVFLCGRKSFRARVLGVQVDLTPEKYLTVLNLEDYCFKIRGEFYTTELSRLKEYLSGQTIRE